MQFDLKQLYLTKYYKLQVEEIAKFVSILNIKSTWKQYTNWELKVTSAYFTDNPVLKTRSIMPSISVLLISNSISGYRILCLVGWLLYEKHSLIWGYGTMKVNSTWFLPGYNYLICIYTFYYLIFVSYVFKT